MHSFRVWQRPLRATAIPTHRKQTQFRLISWPLLFSRVLQLLEPLPNNKCLSSRFQALSQTQLLRTNESSCLVHRPSPQLLPPVALEAMSSSKILSHFNSPHRSLMHHLLSITLTVLQLTLEQIPTAHRPRRSYPLQAQQIIVRNFHLMPL